MSQREDNVLERVAGIPRAGILTLMVLVDERNKRVDCRSVRRIEDLRCRNAVERQRIGNDGRKGFDVCGVATGCAHKAVFANRARVQKLFGSRTAHGARIRLDDHIVKTEAREDALICVALGLIALRQTLVGGIK